MSIPRILGSIRTSRQLSVGAWRTWFSTSRRRRRRARRPGRDPHREDRRGTYGRGLRAFRSRRAAGGGDAAAPDRLGQGLLRTSRPDDRSNRSRGLRSRPGSSITIPPASLHTFTVLSPTAKFLVMSLTGAMGAFHADLDATVSHGRPIAEAAQQIQQVLDRHDVTVAGLQAVR
jgi:hypothetical protein